MGSCVCNSAGMVIHLAHNGRKFLSVVYVSENMGHKLGEFFTARFSEVTPHKRALKRHKKAVRKVKRVKGSERKFSCSLFTTPLTACSLVLKMEAKAFSKFARISYRKVNQVLSLIRGKRVSGQFIYCHLLRRARFPYRKTFKSAAANGGHLKIRS